MPAKPKILFLGTQMEMAGAQHVLLSQAAWFHEHGYSVQAVFFYDKQGLLERWRSEHAYAVLSLDAWRPGGFMLGNLFRLIAGLWKLAGLLKESQVLIAFTPHSNLLGLPVAFFCGTRVRIGTHHGYIEGSSLLLQKLHGWLTNSALCSKMVCVSQQVRALAMRAEGAHPEKLLVIENGIVALGRLDQEAADRLRQSIGLKPGQKMLLTVGRLVKQKGHAVLLDAIPELLDPEAAFVFVGEGPLREELSAQASRLKLAGRVYFLGPRSDVQAWLAAADAFVQPSLWEGLSIALLEALFAGLPVVATRVEGVVDVVEDQRSALLVPPNDAPALAAALNRLLGDPVLSRRIGAAGKQAAESKYTVEAMCLAYERLVNEIEHASS